MRVVPVALLILCALASTVHAGDGPDTPEDDPLLRAVLACPLRLGEALGSAYGVDRHPIDAAFLLDTAGRLLLRATVRIEAGDAAVYETWVGPVHEAGWVPHARLLRESPALVEARARWARMQEHPELLRRALKGAVRTDTHPGLAEVVLSVAVPEGDGGTRVSLRIGIDGQVRGLAFEPGAETYEVVEPAPAPDPVAYSAPALPSLGIADGTWFNVEASPSFEGWRGSPVLVVITDPG